MFMTTMITTYLDIVSAIFSFTFNVILIFFVLTKSPKQFGAYKYLMLSIAVFETAMTLLGAVLAPIHYSHGSAVTIMVKISNTRLTHLTGLILLLVFIFFLGACFAIFAVHFIYRYLAVSGNPLVKSFESWKLLIWFLLPLSSGTTWSVTAYFLCSPDNDAHEYLRNSVSRDFGEKIENFEYVLFFAYKHLNNGDIIFNYNSLVAMGISLFTVSLSFFLILFFGVKCYNHISNLMKNSAVSHQFNVLQQQLFYALVAQTLIPVIFVHLPITMMVLSPLFEIDVGNYLAIVSMSIALYPALDPLPNFFIIKPYRTALFDYLKCRKPVEDNSSLRRWSLSHLNHRSFTIY